jgi:hypothetical protein
VLFPSKIIVTPAAPDLTAAISLSVTITAAVVLALSFIFIEGEGLLPRVSQDPLHFNTSWPYLIGGPIVLLCMVALFVLWVRRRSMVDRSLVEGRDVFVRDRDTSPPTIIDYRDGRHPGSSLPTVPGLRSIMPSSPVSQSGPQYGRMNILQKVPRKGSPSSLQPINRSGRIAA